MADFLNIIDYGAACDQSTDDTQIVNTVMTNASKGSGGVVLIPKGCKWTYSEKLHPNGVVILDYSGYDFANKQWTGQIKIFTKTDDPGSKNANEFLITAPYHPAIVIDNIGADDKASIVFRKNGQNEWKIGYVDNNKLSICCFEAPGQSEIFSMKQHAGGVFSWGVAGGVFTDPTHFPFTGNKSLPEPEVGSMIFDVRKSPNKPIWYSGNGKWVDAMGNPAL